MRINSLINSITCYSGEECGTTSFQASLTKYEENSHHISDISHQIEDPQPSMNLVMEIDPEQNKEISGESVLKLMDANDAAQMHFKLLVQSIKLGSRHDAKKIIGRIRYHLPENIQRSETFAFENTDQTLLRLKERIPPETKIKLEFFEDQNDSKPISFHEMDRKIRIYIQPELDPKKNEIPEIKSNSISLTMIPTSEDKPKRIITQSKTQEQENRAIKNRIKKIEEDPDHSSVMASSMETSLKISNSSHMTQNLRPQDLTDHEVVESISQSSGNDSESSSEDRSK